MRVLASNRVGIMTTRLHWFPGLPESVPAARHFLARELRHEECPDDVGEDAALLVTELAANAVLHARTDFAVSIARSDAGIEVTVTDENPESPRQREPTTEGGRGLNIVDSIASSWGVREAVPGKAVYFTVKC